MLRLTTGLLAGFVWMVSAASANAIEWRLYEDGVNYETRCFVHHVNKDLDAAVPALPLPVRVNIDSLIAELVEDADDLEDALDDEDADDVEDDADDLDDTIDDVQDALDNAKHLFDLSKSAEDCLEDLEDLAKWLKKNV